jgi:uncharacterized protein
MEFERKNILIELQIKKAKETIIDARIALDNNRYRNALNRIYYAVFYIVTALSIKFDFVTSKHKQLMGWFNKNFVHEGKISVELGHIYKTAFDNRQESDYENIFEYNKDEIENYFNDILVFVEEIEKLINEVE